MLLQTERVSKQFGGAYALRDVSFGLEAGEIHGLVGENGAGKSTLIKLLTGVYRLREGRILWDGQPAAIAVPEDARKLGICAIHQDRTLIPTFTGVENAYLGLPYPTRRGRVDWDAMKRRVEETAERLGMALDLEKTAAELPPSQRTELEIVRAMMHGSRLLILDEPTAALTDREAERLFALLQTLKERGTAILYVSHRLGEIFRLTGRVTVLRNGALVETVDTASVSREQLIAKMTGGQAAAVPARRRGFGETVLEAQGIASRDGSVKDGTFAAHAGEVLGIFGLGGSGRTELLECVYGCRPRAGGQVILNGRQIQASSPADSIRRGMALICEDRRGKAMVEGLGVRDNILLSSLSQFTAFGVVRRRDADRAAQAQIDSLQIKLSGMGQQMGELSGGNQQKAVFARALLTAPKVFLCDEPTQAVDVSTRSQIHRLLRQKADEGAAVVMVSSDLTELLETADTLCIMAQGRIAACLANEHLSPRQVLACCYGGTETECGDNG